MKKISLLVSAVLIFSLTACSNSQKNLSANKTSVAVNSESLSVLINTNVDTYSLSDDTSPGITLVPNIKGTMSGIDDRNLKYHWIADEEVFYTGSNPSKELTNIGESVIWMPTKDINYSEATLPIEFNITLKVEEIDTNKVLAEAKLVIEDHGGEYKVRK